MDEDTERAARAAIAEEAMSTVSGARVRDELMDLLAELEAPAGVERMRDLGLDRALHPALDPDPELVASASLGAAAIGADRALAALAALCAGAPVELDLWVAGLHLEARDRDAVSRAARVSAAPGRARSPAGTSCPPSCAISGRRAPGGTRPRAGPGRAGGPGAALGDRACAA